MKKDTVFLTAATAGAAVIAYRLMRGRAYDFRGRSVLLTGGSRGLGLVLARKLAAEGARIAICARDQEELERAEAELRALGGEVLAVRCDVGDYAQVKEMVRSVQRDFGSIDVLINNAGTISVGPMETMTLADYHSAMDVHVWGPLHTILAVLPEMRNRGSGRIANIASIGGKVAIPHLVPYCASKFALVGLSRGLRAELKKDGIVVTTLCPGLMRTGSPRNATFKGQHRAEYAWFSISDSLPGLTISAEAAARRILDATSRGDAEVLFPLTARAATAVNALAPNLTAGLLAAAARLLPGSPDGPTGRRKGEESRSWLSPSWLTRLGERAARRNNQLSPAETRAR